MNQLHHLTASHYLDDPHYKNLNENFQFLLTQIETLKQENNLLKERVNMLETQTNKLNQPKPTLRTTTNSVR